MKRFFYLSLVVVAGCSGMTQQAPRRAPGPKVSKCALEEGEAPFVFMPNGAYEGSYPNGRANLELEQDGTFHLHLSDYRKGEIQWQGKFAWKKQGIGEVLNLCDIRSTNDASTRDVSTAVVGFDEERHEFRVSLSKIGEISFAPAP